MALDWASYRSARGSARARDGFNKRPFPARSWSALLRKTPVAQTPWPYSKLEVQQIAAMLPERFREGALEQIVRAARWYVYCQTQVHRENSNPRKEIEQLRKALNGLFDA